MYSVERVFPPGIASTARANSSADVVMAASIRADHRRYLVRLRDELQPAPLRRPGQLDGAVAEQTAEQRALHAQPLDGPQRHDRLGLADAAAADHQLLLRHQQ